MYLITTPLFIVIANSLPLQVDIEVISNLWYIPRYLNHHGSFSTSSDTTEWRFEPYSDAVPPGGAGAGSWSWLSNPHGRSGILSGYQSAGQKAKLTQTVDFPQGTNNVLGSLWVYSGTGFVNLVSIWRELMLKYIELGYTEIAIEFSNGIYIGTNVIISSRINFPGIIRMKVWGRRLKVAEG